MPTTTMSPDAIQKMKSRSETHSLHTHLFVMTTKSKIVTSSQSPSLTPSGLKSLSLNLKTLPWLEERVMWFPFIAYSELPLLWPRPRRSAEDVSVSCIGKAGQPCFSKVSGRPACESAIQHALAFAIWFHEASKIKKKQQHLATSPELQELVKNCVWYGLTPYLLQAWWLRRL